MIDLARYRQEKLLRQATGSTFQTKNLHPHQRNLSRERKLIFAAHRFAQRRNEPFPAA